MQANDAPDKSLTAGRADQEESAQHAAAQIRVEYRQLEATAAPPSGLLALVRFGTSAPRAADRAPLTIGVQLEAVLGTCACELWHADGPVRAAQVGNLRYAHDENFLFGLIEVEEPPHGGIRSAAEAAYAAIRRFQAQCGFPHLLRMWNYLDAINEGPGDLERYRQFCVGRAHGLGQITGEPYPAATAIGHQRTTGKLQVLWLAGRTAGAAIENPRQISAYRYPRAHGPVSPSFSRATLAIDGTLLVSGTASIVGHVSRHHGEPLEQLGETLRNLGALMSHADRQRNAPADKKLLKVYLRDPALLQPVAARLQALHPHAETIFLAADICRRELLLEIECVCLA